MRGGFGGYRKGPHDLAIAVPNEKALSCLEVSQDSDDGGQREIESISDMLRRQRRTEPGELPDNKMVDSTMLGRDGTDNLPGSLRKLADAFPTHRRGDPEDVSPYAEHQPIAHNAVSALWDVSLRLLTGQ